MTAVAFSFPQALVESPFLSLTEGATLIAFGAAEGAEQLRDRQAAEYLAYLDAYKSVASTAHAAAISAGLSDHWKFEGNRLVIDSIPEIQRLYRLLDERSEQERSQSQKVWRAATQIIKAGSHDKLELFGCLENSRKSERIPPADLVRLRFYTDPEFMDCLLTEDGTQWSQVTIGRIKFAKWRESTSAIPLQAEKNPSLTDAVPKGGRPKGYPWRKIKDRAFAILDDLGIPSPANPDLPSQAALARMLMQYCMELVQEEPANSTMSSHLAQWVEEFGNNRRAGF